MPDHLHWLLQLQDGSLQSLVRRFKSTSGAAINRAFLTPGARVWQPGFHDRAVRDGEDIRGIARYIVANPLRAGLVRSVREYPHWNASWLL
jgi:putative transposase